MTVFGVGIGTIGRWSAVRRLLGDLKNQSVLVGPIVIAVPEGSLTEAVAELGNVLGAARVVPSGLGASTARNAALAEFPIEVDYVIFFNDTSRIAADFFERLDSVVETSMVYALSMRDEQGPRNRLPAPGSPFSFRTAWAAIEPATVLRREALVNVGGYDEFIGTGADSPWQSGEMADLLFRFQVQYGSRFTIDWVPEVCVHAQVEFEHLDFPGRIRKIRAYGRGTGYIYRRWRYPAWRKGATIVGGLTSFLRFGGKFTVRDSVVLAFGRLEGILGITVGESKLRAVKK